MENLLVPQESIAARMYVGSNVRNCYSTATVKGHASAGGIAGQCQLGEGSADNSNYIVNCVAWNDYISSTTDIASGTYLRMDAPRQQDERQQKASPAMPKR